MKKSKTFLKKIKTFFYDFWMINHNVNSIGFIEVRKVCRRERVTATVCQKNEGYNYIIKVHQCLELHVHILSF